MPCPAGYGPVRAETIAAREPAAVADEAAWQAAYECQFVDESHALLPYDLLLARVDDRLNYHLDDNDVPAGDLYAGFDVGRKHDLSVLVVIKRVDDERYRWRGAVELRQSPFDEQYDLLAAVLSRYRLRRLRRLCIDQSGLGMQLAEQLVKNFSSTVEPITITAPMKESLASRLLAVFQRGVLEIPDHRPLIDDLHSMERTVTLSGNVRYTAPRESGSHADRWTALALALHAADTTPKTQTLVCWMPRNPDPFHEGIDRRTLAEPLACWMPRNPDPFHDPHSLNDSMWPRWDGSL